MVNFLTCHGWRSTGETLFVNDGIVLFSAPVSHLGMHECGCDQDLDVSWLLHLYWFQKRGYATWSTNILDARLLNSQLSQVACKHHNLNKIQLRMRL